MLATFTRYPPLCPYPIKGVDREPFERRDDKQTSRAAQGDTGCLRASDCYGLPGRLLQDLRGEPARAALARSRTTHPDRHRLQKVLTHVDADTKPCQHCDNITRGASREPSSNPMQCGAGVKATILNLAIASVAPSTSKTSRRTRINYPGPRYGPEGLARCMLPRKLPCA